MGLFLFALVSLLTRKRVKVFLDRYLIRYFVLCKLISDILCYYFLVPPYQQLKELGIVHSVKEFIQLFHPNEQEDTP